MTTPISNIMNGIADALWVSAYAAWIESIGGRREAQARGLDVPPQGGDWADAAPDVPEEAHAAARALSEAYESDNNCDLMELMRRAGVLAGGKMGPEARRALEQEQRLFGWYLGMMAMGEGVSWFDDHEVFELEKPAIEAHFDGEYFEWGMGRMHRNPPWVPIGVSGGGRYIVYYRDGRKSFAFEDETLAKDWAKEIGGGTVEDRGPGGYVHYARNPAVMKYPCTACGGSGPHRGPGHAYTTAPEPGDPMRYPCTACGGTGPHTGTAGHAYTTDPNQTIDGPILTYNPVGDHVDVTSGPGRGRSGVVESETDRVARVRFDRGGSGHLERSALRTTGPGGRSRR